MPTQIGKTASLDGSLSTTMGMLVTGSIINPRIFISTSIPDLRRAALDSLSRFVACLYLAHSPRAAVPHVFLVHHHLTHKTVREALGYKHPSVASSGWEYGRAGREIHGLVLRAAADHLPTNLVSSFNHYFKDLPYMLQVINPLNLSLSLLKDAESLRLFPLGDAI